jgi:spermidine synthase
MAKNVDKLESIVNDYLFTIRELEYSVMHFIKKSNKSTALDVRNKQRAVIKMAKDYKNESIDFFKGD